MMSGALKRASQHLYKTCVCYIITAVTFLLSFENVSLDIAQLKKVGMASGFSITLVFSKPSISNLDHSS